MTTSQPNGRSDQGSSSTLKGTCWAMAKQAGAATANARAASARKGPAGTRSRWPSTTRNAPLAPNPRRATLITRNAKWCHWTIARSRVSRIS